MDPQFKKFSEPRRERAAPRFGKFFKLRPPSGGAARANKEASAQKHRRHFSKHTHTHTGAAPSCQRLLRNFNCLAVSFFCINYSFMFGFNFLGADRHFRKVTSADGRLPWILKGLHLPEGVSGNRLASFSKNASLLETEKHSFSSRI